MKNNSRWMPAAIAFVVVSLFTSTLQPAAFGQNAEQPAQPGEPVAQQPPAPAPPALLVAARTIAAQAISQTQTTATTATTRPTRLVPPQTSNGKSKKWILILAGAGAAGATAYLVSRGGTNPPPPQQTVITIGAPTVGQPQ